MNRHDSHGRKGPGVSHTRGRRTVASAGVRNEHPKGDSLRVRMYNVLFGDAILVSIFEQREARHILIDVGNVTGDGGDVDVFVPVITDILREIDGQPLDLYVMTHEHMDHVKGLLYASDKLDAQLKDRLRVRQVWLTASAATGYYKTHKDARKKRIEAEEAVRAVMRFVIARHLERVPEARIDGDSAADLVKILSAAPDAVSNRLAALLLNNDFQSTGKCVDYLRQLASPEATFYVHRGCQLDRHPDLLSARVEIWAPEEDTSVYYGRLRPVTLGLDYSETAPAVPTLPQLAPPHGVDAGAFFDLVESRRKGYGENLLTIDKAANNTSVVFCLEWHGWRLLFPGDAEEKSWIIMNQKGVLEQPVDFLKVGHHGSHNGTPRAEILDKIFPKDSQARFAAVCTCANVYGETEETAVPNEATLAELRRRGKVYSVQSLKKGGRLDLVFPGERAGTVNVKERRPR